MGLTLRIGRNQSDDSTPEEKLLDSMAMLTAILRGANDENDVEHQLHCLRREK